MNKKTIRYIGILVIISILIVFLIKQGSFKAVETYIAAIATSSQQVASSTAPLIPMYTYIEVVDGCDHAFVGDCVNMREGPGIEFPVTVKLRTGIVLKVESSTTTSSGVWYKVLFSHELLYPERVKGDWYVSADYVKSFQDVGDHNLLKGQISTSTKRIIVDKSEQKLYAYDDDVLFMEIPISTGLEFTPTPRGTFTIFKMTPSRFMQGPIPGVSDQVYDLPGVPWNMYFTAEGAVIHGAYWHEKFGQPWSHGCVNLSPENAKKLYYWATVGVQVTVRK